MPALAALLLLGALGTLAWLALRQLSPPLPQGRDPLDLGPALERLARQGRSLDDPPLPPARRRGRWQGGSGRRRRP